MKDGFVALLLEADLLPHLVALLAGVTLTATSQILMKFGARKKGSWRDSFFNPWTVMGYAMLAIVTVLTTYALQKVDLKYATAMTGLTYVLVILASRFVLGESVSLRRSVGALVIVLGIVLFHF